MTLALRNFFRLIRKKRLCQSSSEKPVTSNLYPMAKICFLITLFLFTATSAFTQKPDYSGTWVLNLEKSKLTSPHSARITKTVFVIEQYGDKLTLTRYHYRGDKKRRLKIKMTADSQQRKVELFFNGKVEWIAENLRASLWNKGFSNVVNYSFGASQDEFIADETFTSAKKNYHNYWVFDRSLTGAD